MPGMELCRCISVKEKQKKHKGWYFILIKYSLKNHDSFILHFSFCDVIKTKSVIVL